MPSTGFGNNVLILLGRIFPDYLGVDTYDVEACLYAGIPPVEHGEMVM